jgi:hypothetical protein
MINGNGMHRRVKNAGIEDGRDDEEDAIAANSCCYYYREGQGLFL